MTNSCKFCIIPCRDSNIDMCAPQRFVEIPQHIILSWAQSVDCSSAGLLQQACQPCRQSPRGPVGKWPFEDAWIIRIRASIRLKRGCSELYTHSCTIPAGSWCRSASCLLCLADCRARHKQLEDGRSYKMGSRNLLLVLTCMALSIGLAEQGLSVAKKESWCQQKPHSRHLILHCAHEAKASWLLGCNKMPQTNASDDESC